MGLSSDTRDSESRLAAYVAALTAAVGHADRVAPFRSYCVGLLLPGDRKSVEPMAARVAPERVRAAHQSLHHFVATADWSDDAVLAAICSQVLPLIERRGASRGWMIDDTAIPKTGTHSVGVGRQYCGQLGGGSQGSVHASEWKAAGGKQENWQVAVSLSLANDQASLPIAHRLYLPRAGADEPARRARAGVPDDIAFQTKPQIRAALDAGVPPAPVLAEAGYGGDPDLRDGITELGLRHVVGIQSSTSLWPPGRAPLPPKPWNGRGRRPSLVQRDDTHKPVSAQQVSASLPRREGSNAPLAAVRVRPAHRDCWRSTPRPEEWLLLEWPVGEPEPTKHWLATLPADTPRRPLVDLAKLRWRIERDYQDLKQGRAAKRIDGLGHYEGRGWRGFHHHATLCIAAYGFLIAERATIPPSTTPRPSSLQASPLPATLRPRGAPDPA